MTEKQPLLAYEVDLTPAGKPLRPEIDMGPWRQEVAGGFLVNVPMAGYRPRTEGGEEHAGSTVGQFHPLSEAPEEFRVAILAALAGRYKE